MEFLLFKEQNCVKFILAVKALSALTTYRRNNSLTCFPNCGKLLKQVIEGERHHEGIVSVHQKISVGRDLVGFGDLDCGLCNVVAAAFVAGNHECHHEK
jgi:hypothetical protein